MREMLIVMLAPVVHVAAVPVINKQKEPGVGPKKEATNNDADVDLKASVDSCGRSIVVGVVKLTIWESDKRLS